MTKGIPKKACEPNTDPITNRKYVSLEKSKIKKRRVSNKKIVMTGTILAPTNVAIIRSNCVSAKLMKKSEGRAKKYTYELRVRWSPRFIRFAFLARKPRPTRKKMGSAVFRNMSTSAS